MEKFGIFELLDALSALTGSDAATRPESASAPTDPVPAQKQANVPNIKGDALAAFLSRRDKIAGQIKGKGN